MQTYFKIPNTKTKKPVRVLRVNNKFIIYALLSCTHDLLNAATVFTPWGNLLPKQGVIIVQMLLSIWAKY